MPISFKITQAYEFCLEMGVVPMFVMCDDFSIAYSGAQLKALPFYTGKLNSFYNYTQFEYNQNMAIRPKYKHIIIINYYATQQKNSKHSINLSHLSSSLG